MKASKNSTPKISIPKTTDDCSPTITSSFGAGISVANLLGVNHFPKGGALHQENQSSILTSMAIAEPSAAAITRQASPTISARMAQPPTQY